MTASVLAADVWAFEVTHRQGAARGGRLVTSHGAIETPAFVAVGTQGTVKSLAPEDVRAAGTQAIFANTYHLYLRPGAETVAALGGLHRWMGWPGPLMTDSGGFQVFSLGAGITHGVGKIASMFPGDDAAAGARRRRGDGRPLVEVTEDGVRFRSHLDGSSHWFSPERSIELQRLLGADMILTFDECTSPLHDHDYTRQAMERTHRWALRCLEAFQGSTPGHGHRQALYGIIQGGAYEDLREASTRTIAALPFDGLAIGGSLGRSRADMHRVLEQTVPLLPPDTPRHLLGIGEIPDIFEIVERGIDTFDCVAPTRMARNGALLARTVDGRRLPRFRINLRNARYHDDPGPPVADCCCYTCQQFSRSYLHHLFRSNELLAYRLATLHNLAFLNGLLADIRDALRTGTFERLKADWLVAA
jgi:tRNA-guanine transglycosylase